MSDTDSNIDQEDAFSLYDRALAYRESGEMEKAYIYISRAIELEGGNAFYHYIRGSVLDEAGEYRAALIDYDISVKINPDDTFYLCCRAETFYNLNKLQEALADCMKVIGLDDKKLTAYILRRDIYQAMGLNDKAAGDQEIIDRLRKN